jgi:hypothetical protein
MSKNDLHKAGTLFNGTPKVTETVEEKRTREDKNSSVLSP